jgi:hypothetical protein
MVDWGSRHQLEPSLEHVAPAYRASLPSAKHLAVVYGPADVRLKVVAGP